MTHLHIIMLSYVVISQVLLFTYSFYLYLLFTYRLWGNNVGDAGAQALAEGLQYCNNLLELRLVHNTTLRHVLHCIALRQACNT